VAGQADGEIRYAKHGSGHLAYRVWGQGPPLVYVPSVFIPISDMDDEPAHDRFLARLAAFATTIVFDRQGVGLSDPMTEPPTVDGWADQILSVVRAAGFERAFLLANALGAAAAATLAITQPERVQGLILALGILRWDRPAEFSDLVGAAVPGTDSGIDVVSQLAPSRVDDPRFRQWLDGAGRRGASPAVAQALLDMQARSDVGGLQASAQLPVLVIERPDRPLSVFGPASTGSSIPGARVVEVAGIDVLPWLPDSEALVAEVEEFVTGARGSAARPVRTLLTVMFTDVVGSTDTAARLGDAGWRDVLETHDRLMRHELGRFDGREIDTAGDGFLVTFTTPTTAVRCATRLHRAMREIGVQLRVGIHCGEVEVRERSIAGMAVHLAARVQSKADPGETLLTSTAREAMVGSGIGVAPRGVHTLKGVPDEWAVFAVVAP
jgi:class 3 adenylate cyclase